MEITRVLVHKVDWGNSVVGLASITLDDCFVVRDLKIVKGKNGYFVAMPSRKGGDGKYRDVCHPVTSDFRDQLQKRVLKAFETEV